MDNLKIHILNIVVASRLLGNLCYIVSFLGNLYKLMQIIQKNSVSVTGKSNPDIL